LFFAILFLGLGFWANWDRQQAAAREVNASRQRAARFRAPTSAADLCIALSGRWAVEQAGIAYVDFQVRSEGSELVLVTDMSRKFWFAASEAVFGDDAGDAGEGIARGLADVRCTCADARHVRMTFKGFWERYWILYGVRLTEGGERLRFQIEAADSEKSKRSHVATGIWSAVFPNEQYQRLK
jgi:hypothetical protein